MTRFLTLYLRSRRAPAALGAILAATVFSWALGLASRTPEAHLTMAGLAAALCAALLAPGLAGADGNLERTAALPWPRWRAAHLLAGAAVVGGALVATAVTGEPIAPALVLIRDVAGLVGLAALTTTVVGTNGAWVLPLGWSALGIMAGPQTGSRLAEAGTWLVQPAGSSAAAVVAAVLGLAGLVAYAARGASAASGARNT